MGPEDNHGPSISAQQGGAASGGLNLSSHLASSGLFGKHGPKGPVTFQQAVKQCFWTSLQQGTGLVGTAVTAGIARGIDGTSALPQVTDKALTSVTKVGNAALPALPKALLRSLIAPLKAALPIK